MTEKLNLEIKWIPLSRINELPNSTGVYVFQGNKEKLYIGKAVNIRSRVKSHFQQPVYKDKVFINQVEKVGFIETDSEIEALVLEANLIKQYLPKYNVIWRDDKNFFYVGITREEFPRVFVTHQPLAGHPEGGRASGRPTKGSHGGSTGFLPAARSAQNDCLYIGPFVDGRALKNALKVLRRVFPFRTCRTLPDKPCLWYQLGQCPAPCHPKSKNQKSRIKDICKKNIKNLVHILEGNKSKVLKHLEKEMQQASEKKKFEEAGKIRDQIRALENVLVHSHVLEHSRSLRPAPLFKKKSGGGLRSRAMFPETLGFWRSPSACCFPTRGNPGFPDPLPLYRKFNLIEFPIQEQLPKNKINWSQIERQLKRILNIKASIRRIEGYDVSNIQGKEATGSMVVFSQALPNKSEYRRFRIRTKETPDDTAMLREVLKRRLSHQEWDLPQIMLIDGGKAQLGAAIKEITNCELGITNIKVVALAKHHNELFVEDRKKPLLLKDLPQGVAYLFLRIRDEAHRFAIKYHKTLRKKFLLK